MVTFFGSTVRRGSFTLDFELKRRISGGWLWCPSKVEASAVVDRSGTATLSLTAPWLHEENAKDDGVVMILIKRKRLLIRRKIARRRMPYDEPLSCHLLVFAYRCKLQLHSLSLSVRRFYCIIVEEAITSSTRICTRYQFSLSPRGS